MTDPQPESPSTLTKIVRELNDWKWVIGAAVVIITGYVRHDVMISELLTRKTAETEQWRRINATEDMAKEIKGQVDHLNEVVTPEGLEKWGRVQQTVEDDHKALMNHLINHPH